MTTIEVKLIFAISKARAICLHWGLNPVCVYMLESRAQMSQGAGQCSDGGILWPSENQLQDEDSVHVLTPPALSWIGPVCVQIHYGEHISKGKLYKVCQKWVPVFKDLGNPTTDLQQNHTQLEWLDYKATSPSLPILVILLILVNISQVSRWLMLSL